MAKMSGLVKLNAFVGKLQGDKLFGAGIMGATSSLQTQTDELRRTFAIWRSNSKDQKLKQNFIASLYTANAVSVITKEELEYCQRCVEEVS